MKWNKWRWDLCSSFCWRTEQPCLCCNESKSKSPGEIVLVIWPNFVICPWGKPCHWWIPILVIDGEKCKVWQGTVTSETNIFRSTKCRSELLVGFRDLQPLGCLQSVCWFAAPTTRNHQRFSWHPNLKRVSTPENPRLECMWAFLLRGYSLLIFATSRAVQRGTSRNCYVQKQELSNYSSW